MTPVTYIEIELLSSKNDTIMLRGLDNRQIFEHSFGETRNGAILQSIDLGPDYFKEHSNYYFFHKEFPMREISDSLKNKLLRNSGINKKIREIKKIFNIQIIPIEQRKDSAEIFCKYMIQEKKEQIDDKNIVFATKVDEFIMTVPLKKSIQLEFLKEALPEYKANIKVIKAWVYSKKPDYDYSKENMYSVHKDFISVAGKIKESIAHSDKELNNLNFKLQYVRSRKDCPDIGVESDKYPLEPVNSVYSSNSEDDLHLPDNCSFATFTFPFLIYNSQKVELYKNEEWVKSLYSQFAALIVPIKQIGNKITVDAYILYKPVSSINYCFKKVIEIEKGESIKLKIQPNEWTVESHNGKYPVKIDFKKDYFDIVDDYLILSLDDTK
jgi:hypothetical protein